MSDHTQADAGRERDPIPTARERDQDRQALSAPVDESASAHADAPTGAPALPRSAAGLRLDAWRERGADRMDPVRFRFMEALERRAAPHAGAARALLDQRLAALLDAYAADLSGRGRARQPRARAVASAWPRGAGLRRRRYAHRRSPARRHPGQPGPRARHRPRRALARRLPGAAAAGRVPRYLGQGQRQPPAAPIGTAGARQCRPAQFQQPVHRSLALMRQLARLSAPVPVLPGRAGLDGAVRWRGGRCQGSRARFGQGWRQGCGQGG